MTKRNIGLLSGAVLSIALLILGGFSIGFAVGRKIPETVIVSGVKGVDEGTASADFGTFWEAWKTIDENYLKAKDVTDKTRVNGAIAGLVQSLGDPYSEYFTPEGAESFRQDVEGTFSGIGAEIGIRNNQLVIVAPLKETPAEKAGLRPNDQILLIDATSTDKMPVDTAVSLIRGPENSTVKLTVFREGWPKPKEYSLVRKQITAPTLDFKMLPGGIAYVQLYSFNGNADRLFWSAMMQASRSGAKGVVLDLRGNPGGYLEVAVNLSGWFLHRGTVVVKEEGREGITDTLRADGNEALVDIPTVVLIDKGSASASEILAGTLRDNRKIKLVGETSFGKGTVQQFMDLRDGSVVKLTIAHWVMPSGKILDHDGLVPDYEVKLSDKDIEAKKDPQLDKAVEVLKSEL